MSRFLPLLLLVSFFLFHSCDNSDGDELSMQFEETNCANPWEADPGMENYIVEVRKYLEDSGIKVLSIYIDVYDENAGINCTACNCPTGRNIVISVLPEDVDDAKALGFILME